ncbi:MAG: TIM barrel protein [Bacteroidota bacterium]|nr:TIM barrel protein [Bacteroidota bacterium]
MTFPLTKKRAAPMPLRDLRRQATLRTSEALLRHLREFRLEPRFSAGIWYFSPAASRFHAPYTAPRSIEERLEIAASLVPYGLSALEAHYPTEINHDNLPLWKTFLRESGMRLITVIPQLFHDRLFEWGSLSNPDPAVRRAAVERTLEAFLLNKELDTDFAVVWPGIDGYENPFGMNFAEIRARFADGLAEAMDAVPGVRVAFEPKPYEPRGRILFGTTAEGMLLCRAVESRLQGEQQKRLLGEGHALCCMNPEIGHMLMSYEDLPYAVSWPLSEGRLAHIHINSQPAGNFDQDLNVGVVHPEQFEAMMYVLAMHGYEGFFGIDINPVRMPVETAIRINIDAVRAAADRIQSVDHESVLYAVEHPDRARGWLEAYLVRLRSANPRLLPPLDDVRSGDGEGRSPA